MVKKIKKSRWVKVRGGWKKGKKFLTIRKVNFSWEPPQHNVIVYDRSKPSIESTLGKVIYIKHLGTKTQALSHAKAIITKNKR